MIEIFIDGKRVEINSGEVNRQIILGHADIDPADRLVLMECGDGPDEVLGNEYIPIRGGERFVTVPRATWGG